MVLNGQELNGIVAPSDTLRHVTNKEMIKNFIMAWRYRPSIRL